MSRHIKTGLLSGSFNPVHIGHIEIARSFIESQEIDELWVYPTPVSPFKSGDKSSDLLPYTQRFELLRTAFERLSHPGILVKSIEDKLDPPYYTVRTIRHLFNQYQGREFYLCIGGDSLSQFTQWHKYEEILSMARLLVAKRPGVEYEQSDINEISDSVTYIDHEPVEASSTQIRTWLKKGEYDQARACLPEGVLKELISLNAYG